MSILFANIANVHATCQRRSCFSKKYESLCIMNDSLMFMCVFVVVVECLIHCCLFIFVGIMAALRPLTKPNIVKKRTKKFIRHQSDRYVKIRVGNLEYH